MHRLTDMIYHSGIDRLPPNRFDFPQCAACRNVSGFVIRTSRRSPDPGRVTACRWFFRPFISRFRYAVCTCTFVCRRAQQLCMGSIRPHAGIDAIPRKQIGQLLTGSHPFCRPSGQLFNCLPRCPHAGLGTCPRAPYVSTPRGTQGFGERRASAPAPFFGITTDKSVLRRRKAYKRTPFHAGFQIHFLEHRTGFEPARPAWKAGMLPNTSAVHIPRP